MRSPESKRIIEPTKSLSMAKHPEIGACNWNLIWRIWVWIWTKMMVYEADLVGSGDVGGGCSERRFRT